MPLEEGVRLPFKQIHCLSPAELMEVEITIKEMPEREHMEPNFSPFGGGV